MLLVFCLNIWLVALRWVGYGIVYVCLLLLWLFCISFDGLLVGLFCLVWDDVILFVLID